MPVAPGFNITAQASLQRPHHAATSWAWEQCLPGFDHSFLNSPPMSAQSHPAREYNTTDTSMPTRIWPFRILDTIIPYAHQLLEPCNDDRRFRFPGYKPRDAS